MNNPAIDPLQLHQHEAIDTAVTVVGDVLPHEAVSQAKQTEWNHTLRVGELHVQCMVGDI